MIAGPTPGRRATRLRVLVGASLAAAVLLAGLPIAVLAMLGAPVPILAGLRPTPVAPDRRPAVSDDQVVAAVSASLDRCFDRGRPPPWRCPQLRDSRPEDWQVRGDPFAGATVHYDGMDVFTVAAHFVAVLDGVDDPSEVMAIDAAPLRARVEWDGEALAVTSIDRAGAGPPVPRTATGDDADVMRLAGVHLGLCASESGRDIAQGCPSHLVPEAGPQTCPDPHAVVSWKELSDPASGATVAYQGETGLYRVSGRYALEESVAQPVQCRGSARKQGPYLLVIVFERDREGASVPAFLEFAWR